MKRNFKIKNSFYESLLLAFEVGRLKRFFPLFVLFTLYFGAGVGFAYNGSAGADPVQTAFPTTLSTPGSTSSTKGLDSAGDGAAPLCDSVLLDKATNATTGMNMESHVLVGQAVTNSTQVLAGDSAKSAKIAHQGKAAIDGTLSAVALKRYVECSSAITECETICQSAITKCNNIINSDPGLLPDPAVAECKTNIPEYKSTLSDCSGQQSICAQAGLQAGLSGLSALTSLFAAKQLSDCEGDECDGTKTPPDKKITTPPPKPPPIPQVVDAPRPDQYTYTGFAYDSFDPNNPNFGSPALLPPAPDKPKPQKSDKKQESQPKNNPSDDSFSDYSPSGLVAGSSSSGDGSTSSPAGSQGGLASRGFDKKLNMFEGGDEENGDFEDIKGKYSSQGMTGSFTGGAGYGPSHRGVNSSYGASRQSGKTKTAAAKKENLKRKIFNKAGGGPHSIFEKMSRTIQSFCSKGAEKCH